MDHLIKILSLSIVTYVGMEIADKLEDANALSPILETVDDRHTIAMLWSSKVESSQNNSQEMII
jgi:hypothetical protein